MMKRTEASAAETLLDKRVRVNIPAPRLLRLLRIRTVPLRFYRPVYAQLLSIARAYVRLDIDLAELEKGDAPALFSAIAEKGRAASRIIALGFIRGPVTSFFFARPLAWYLRAHIDALTMAELTKLIVYLSGGENFASIIRSIAHMKVTTPTMKTAATETTTLSQKENGS
jgi:hypothetical protein